jgi:hypothetical protein
MRRECMPKRVAAHVLLDAGQANGPPRTAASVRQRTDDRGHPAYPLNCANWIFDPVNLTAGASIMGKYVLGWIMGVPLVVLVVLYLIFH